MTLTTAAEPATKAASRNIPSVWTKLAYGFGAVAFGVKNNGFDYFFLIFYSQVVGVDARYVGAALTIALVFDAFSDPIVGYWSDNFRSRWGRRHPFMYGAAIPVTLSYFFMWYPPTGWSDAAMFWYLLILAVLIRTFITFYETPSTALTPELTDDYDQRSSIMSYRYYFGWTGGNAMTVIMFLVIFPAFVTADIADGRFNPDSYVVFGLIGSVLIFSAIMISALGTHSRIPHLIVPPERSRTLFSSLYEILETLADRSFLALFSGALFWAIATGIAGSLAFYLYTYFWEFSSYQTGVITFGVFISAVIGSVMAPIVTKTVGKKYGAMSIGIIAFVGSPLPVALRLFGVMPENGTDLLFWIVFFAITIDVGLIICFQILFSSMIADLVEQRYLTTQRRSEGVLFAAVTFIRKVVQGLGVTTAAMILYFAEFPAGAAPGEVSADAVWKLGAYYVPTILAVYITMIACVSFYRLDRGQHEENLRQIAAARDTVDD